MFCISVHQTTALADEEDRSPQTTSLPSTDLHNFFAECFDQPSKVAAVANDNDELKRYLKSQDKLIED